MGLAGRPGRKAAGSRLNHLQHKSPFKYRSVRSTRARACSSASSFFAAIFTRPPSAHVNEKFSLYRCSARTLTEFTTPGYAETCVKVGKRSFSFMKNRDDHKSTTPSQARHLHGTPFMGDFWRIETTVTNPACVWDTCAICYFLHGSILRKWRDKIWHIIWS